MADAGRSDVKRFEAEIASVLQSFERAREWADLSNCLSRLQKVLVRYPLPITAIPSNELLAKRLGQCLHNRLPDCATHVRPLFLDIIEKYYVPLHSRLLPCLTGLLVCLLPGLENAADPSHDRLMGVLQKVADECVGVQAFCEALWIVTLRTPRARLPALQVFYSLLGPSLLVELPEEQVAVFLPERGTLVLSAFERLFNDSNVLVRRQLLDLLIMHVPLSSTIFDYDQKVRLLSSSLQVLATSEWSLTRRFLNWITNQADMLSIVDLSYFRTQVRDELCEALNREFVAAKESATSRDDILRPLKIFRVICSEAEELTPLLFSRLTLRLLSYAYTMNPSMKPAVLEILKPLLSNQEAAAMSSVWSALDAALEEAAPDTKGNGLLEPLNLSLFFLQEVLGDADALELPRVAAQGLRAFSRAMHHGNQQARLELLEFTHRCLVQLGGEKRDIGRFGSPALTAAAKAFFEDIERIVESLPGSLVSSSESELPETLSEVVLFLFNSDRKDDCHADWLKKLAAFIGRFDLQDIEWVSARMFLSILEGVPSLAEYYIAENPQNVRALATRLWDHVVDNSLGRRAPALLLRLHRLEDHVVAHGRIVQGLLVTDLSHHNYDRRLVGFQRFTIMWQLSHTFYPEASIFSEAMGLVLDCLDAPEPSLRHMCCSWLSSTLTEHLPHIIDPLFEDLLSPDIQRSSGLNRMYLQLYDTARTTFVMSRLTSIVRAEPRTFIAAAQERAPSPSILQANWAQSSGVVADCKGYADDRCVVDYLDLFCVTAIRFIMTETSSDFGQEFARQNLMVQSASAEFLRIFLTSASSCLSPSCRAAVHHFLASPLLMFFTTCDTTTLHIQCLDVLQHLMTTLLDPLPPESTTLLEEKLPGAETELHEKAREAKSAQISQLPHFIDLVRDVLPATLRILDSCVVAGKQPPIDVLYSSTLSRLVHFSLFVCRLIPEHHRDRPVVCDALLLRYITLLQSVPSIVPCYHLLRGLEALVSMLLKGPRPVSTMTATSSHGFWSTFFGTSDSDTQHQASPAALAWLVFRENCPGILLSLAAVVRHALKGVGRRKSLLVESDEVAALWKHTKSGSDLAVSDELVYFELCTLIVNMFERAAPELLLSLLYLGEDYYDSTIQAFANSEVIAIEDIIQALLPLLASSFKTTPAQTASRIQTKLPSNYVARSVNILALLNTLLEAFRHRLRRSTHGQVQEEWTVLAKVLGLVLSEGSQPAHYLWMLAVIQQLDLYRPSRDSFFGSNIKKLRRDLQDLSHYVALIAAQQFHLHKSITFDLTPPLPPSLAVLQKLVPSGAPPLTRCPESKASQQTVIIPEVDSVACAAQLALGAMISVAEQLSVTQKRTLVGGTLTNQFGIMCGKMVLQAVLRNCALETLQYRYLGLYCAERLPLDLVPSSIVPAKQLFADFISSPAFGVSSSIFAQASPGVNTGVTLFRGFDRRCLRSLATSIRRACEGEADSSALIDTLTLSRPAGVFTSRETELWRKARELKRLSFIILSCRKDFFISRVPSIIERVLESLKSDYPNVNSQIRLHEQVFLCLRVLLFRTSAHALATIWPVVLMEATRVCSQPSTEFGLVLAVLKLIDLAVLLDIPDFHLHQWIFVIDSLTPSSRGDGEDASSFVPLCGRLGQGPIDDKDTGAQFSEAMGRRRCPLIRERSATTWSDLRRVARRLYDEALTYTIVGTAIDEDAALRSIEDDLLECPDWLLDWGCSMYENHSPKESNTSSTQLSADR